MRYSASEKLEIIRLVEQSHLPVRRTLGQIGIPRSTFYRWYDQYQTGGPEALDDRSPRPDRVWNRIPDDVRSRVVTLALDEPELSPHPARELLSARRSRSSDRCIRRVLQPPALSREHRQSHPGRRLLRAQSNHPAGKRKDQTQDHPKPSVASPQTSRVTSTMMRQTLSWFRPPPVSKSLTTDSAVNFGHIFSRADSLFP